MREIVLIAHNVRSAHNIGSLLRTADGLGVKKVYLSGYSPYPPLPDDGRLPHLAVRTGRRIAKTALGAETSVAWEHRLAIEPAINELKQAGYLIAALEQTPGAIGLVDFIVPAKIALLVGNEVDGLDDDVLGLSDRQLEIPMAGQKESFNVAVATAIALFYLRFSDKIT